MSNFLIKDTPLTVYIHFFQFVFPILILFNIINFNYSPYLGIFFALNLTTFLVLVSQPAISLQKLNEVI